MRDLNNKYYITLTGAKKNVGDFLITERSMSLLEKIAPEFDFHLHPHWEEFNDLDYVNNSQGIIILGGPGFQRNMYPGVYKLTNKLNDIKVPIHTLGVGWKGVPGDETTEKLYKFTESANKLLSKMEVTEFGMSCRDYQTKRTLKNNGYKNVTMTGCPVWYDLPSLGKKFKAPKKIKKIVYTPAQDHTFSNQSIKVMEFLQKKYKDSEIIVSFHRGIGEVDTYTPENDAENTRKIADAATKLGMKVVDVSYSTKKISFYEECDLHIGYRVHAHIFFLSKRLPSILLHEDGRGNGVSEALNSPGLDAYNVAKVYSRIFSAMNKNKKMLTIYKKLAFKVKDNINIELNNLISKIEKVDYEMYKDTSVLIDNHYSIMEKYVKTITKGDL